MVGRLILILAIMLLGSGCTTSEVLLTYLPQGQVDELEEARGIPVRVKVNDLRDGKTLGLRVARANFSYATINYNNSLTDFLSNAIETELIRRGFNIGEKVLIEVDLIKFHSYLYHAGLFYYKKVVAVIIFHVNVKTSNGVRLFQKFIRQREETSTESGYEESAKLALNVVLRNGITNLTNDPDFINSIVKAGTL